MVGQSYVAEFDGREVGRVSSADRLGYAVVVRNNVWLARQRAYHGSGVARRESVEALVRGDRVRQAVPDDAGEIYLVNRVRQFEADVADGRFLPRVAHWCETLAVAQDKAALMRDPAVQVLGIVRVRAERKPSQNRGGVRRWRGRGAVRRRGAYR